MARDDYNAIRARELRRDGGLAERKVWERPYFADFACISRKLVIEVDGDHHAFQVEANARRTAAKEREGWRVVRFWANEVVQNSAGLWAEIEQVIDAHPPHLASPPRGRGT